MVRTIRWVVVAFAMMTMCWGATAFAQDLQVSSLTSSSTTPKFGDQLTISITVKNTSTKASLASVVGVYFSNNETITNQDRLLSTANVPALAANATHKATVTVTIPADVGVGKRWLGAFADYDNRVAEVDEGNNTKSLVVTVSVGPAPDLSPTVLTASKTNVGSGETITVNFTVFNVGSAEAPASQATLYLSTNPNITTFDRVLKNLPIPKIAAGKSYAGTTSITIPTGLNGTYWLGVFADRSSRGASPPGQFSELNENNNTRNLPLDISSPDLRISSILVQPSVFNANDTITVNLNVRNAGNAAAAATTLDLYFSADASLSSQDRFVKSVAVPAVPGNQTINVKSTFQATSAMMQGFARAFYVIGVADSKKVVAETSETNNNASIRVGIRGIDLTPVSFSLASSTLARGEQVTVTFKVRNNGTQASLATNASIHYSVDARFTNNDARVGNVQIPVLAAGKEQTFTAQVRVPNNASLGSRRYFFVNVDSDRKNTETNENNNTNGLPFTVGFIDLIPFGVAVSPTSSLPGKTVTLSFSISNNGNKEAPASTAGVYYSTNSTITARDQRLRDVSIPKIAPGKDYTGRVTVTVPANYTPRTGYLGIFADRNLRVSESNEGNNGRGVRFTVSGSVDLQPTSFVPQFTTPRQGQSIYADIRVKNNGSTASQNVLVGIYLSKDRTFDATDARIGLISLPAVAGGRTSSPRRGTLQIPATTSVGPAYLIAWVDYNSRQAETSETNNRIVIPITVQGAPDLATLALVPSLLKPTRGAAFSAKVTVKNLVTSVGSAASLVSMYLSKDTAFNTSGASPDVFLGGASLVALRGGQQVEVNFANLRIPANTALGKYYLIAWADSRRVVGESNEANNFKVQEIEVVAAPVPDLVPQTLSVTPTSRKPGEAFTLKFTIQNAGTANAGPTTAAIYFADASTPNAADVLLKQVNIPALTAGKGSAQTQSLTVPAGAKVGDRFVRVVADFRTVVVEADEKNNNATVGLKVLATDPDVDGDGSPASKDCNDNDKTVYPGAKEVCDGKDNNCDRKTDEGNPCPANFTCSAAQKQCIPVSEPSTENPPDTTDAGPPETQPDPGACPGGCPQGQVCVAGQCVPTETTPDDGGVSDVPPSDVPPSDVPPSDVPPSDGGPTDSEPTDENPQDLPPRDETTPDTIEPDTVEPDAIEPDTVEPDTTEPDTAEPDTAEPDDSPNLPDNNTGDSEPDEEAGDEDVVDGEGKESGGSGDGSNSNTDTDGTKTAGGCGCSTATAAPAIPISLLLLLLFLAPVLRRVNRSDSPE